MATGAPYATLPKKLNLRSSLVKIQAQKVLKEVSPLVKDAGGDVKRSIESAELESNTIALISSVLGALLNMSFDDRLHSLIVCQDDLFVEMQAILNRDVSPESKLQAPISIIAKKFPTQLHQLQNCVGSIISNLSLSECGKQKLVQNQKLIRASLDFVCNSNKVLQFTFVNVLKNFVMSDQDQSQQQQQSCLSEASLLVGKFLLQNPQASIELVRACEGVDEQKKENAQLILSNCRESSSCNQQYSSEQQAASVEKSFIQNQEPQLNTGEKFTLKQQSQLESKEVTQKQESQPETKDIASKQETQLETKEITKKQQTNNINNKQQLSNQTVPTKESEQVPKQSTSKQEPKLVPNQNTTNLQFDPKQITIKQESKQVLKQISSNLESEPKQAPKQNMTNQESEPASKQSVAKQQPDQMSKQNALIQESEQMSNQESVSKQDTEQKQKVAFANQQVQQIQNQSVQKQEIKDESRLQRQSNGRVSFQKIEAQQQQIPHAEIKNE